MNNKIVLKRGVKANEPVLNVGEIGFVTDENQIIVGNSSGNRVFYDSEHINRMSGGWRIYDGFAEVNSSYSHATPIDTLTDAMNDKSILIADVAVSGTSDVYPKGFGTLTVTKINENRIELTFTSNHDSDSWGYWVSQSNAGKFRGWRQMNARATDLGMYAEGVTKENVFVNPPLNNMAVMTRKSFPFSAEESATLKTPTASGTSEYWETITLKGAATRAVQLAIQAYKGSYNGAFFIRTRHIDHDDFSVWQDWQRVAVGMPSPVSLPLASGIAARGFRTYYYKNAFGEVVIHANLEKSNGFSFANGDILMTLPAGYRPKTDGLEFPALSWNGASCNSFYARIATNGQIVVTGATSLPSNSNVLSFNVIFLAEQ